MTAVAWQYWGMFAAMLASVAGVAVLITVLVVPLLGIRRRMRQAQAAARSPDELLVHIRLEFERRVAAMDRAVRVFAFIYTPIVGEQVWEITQYRSTLSHWVGIALCVVGASLLLVARRMTRRHLRVLDGWLAARAAPADGGRSGVEIAATRRHGATPTARIQACGGCRVIRRGRRIR